MIHPALTGLAGGGVVTTINLIIRHTGHSRHLITNTGEDGTLVLAVVEAHLLQGWSHSTTMLLILSITRLPVSFVCSVRWQKLILQKLSALEGIL